MYMCVLAGYANFIRRLVVTWLRKTAQLGGALPGYTGSRDDRIDLLGQPFPLAEVASCVSNKTSLEK